MQIMVVVVFSLLVMDSRQTIVMRCAECNGGSSSWRLPDQASNVVVGQSVDNLQQAVSSPAADYRGLQLLQQQSRSKSSSSKRRRHVVVDLNALQGHFRSVQEAVNSIPDGNPDKLIIHINAGTYL
jgi:predicted nucleic acid-binding Zn ribbon protein